MIDGPRSSVYDRVHCLSAVTHNRVPCILRSLLCVLCGCPNVIEEPLVLPVQVIDCAPGIVRVAICTTFIPDSPCVQQSLLIGG